MKQINQLYNQSLNAKVFAQDTAQGTLLGIGNPNQWGQAQKYGMQPYEFGQAMKGYNAVGIDPTSPNTFEMFGNTTYDKLRDTYGYSNPAQASHLADMARLIANGQAEVDGEYADSLERGFRSENKRDMTNDWLESILDGTTKDSFDDWAGITGQARVNANYEGIHDSDSDDGGGAASSNPGTNDGTHNAGGDERY